VADEGMTVLLSSHVVGDLERVCDYLIIIANGQVQVAGDIEEMISSHHLLVGPRSDHHAPPPGVQIIKEQHSERQTSLWVRGELPPLTNGWREERLPLEELVITYLSAGASPSRRLEVVVS
jgi:ABC-2 type transport system ATP-binding protein